MRMDNIDALGGYSDGFLDLWIGFNTKSKPILVINNDGDGSPIGPLPVLF
jgi:hypothetical protein